ncbi:MAG: tetratricopeptide repeat protein [Woeseiaceae bacterium]|nr:tetratricopeptide repeat protein [Woeseiaceae bacterium]
MSFVSELQRRNVFRVAAAYLVVGWLLTEVLTTLLPELGAPAWMSRAVILLFAFGFIPVVVLSWVYEITPDGIRRESELDDQQRRTSSPVFAYAMIGIAAVLTVALAVLGARTDVEAPRTRAVNQASVAVLPFANMSANRDNEYFSDGLTETLLHMLTQIPGLQVAARTSSFAFKDRNMTAVEIADALGVAHILEGSVQMAGARVRITAQLIRAEDGFHVWSKNYDRELDDIFAIQDEIAGEVGGLLSASLLGDKAQTLAGVGTENTDAYDLYLQALQAQTKGSYGGLQAAENLLKGALATDPNYIDAKVQLAVNHWKQFETGLIPMDEAIGEIRAMSDQVLAARPDDTTGRAMRMYANTIRNISQGNPESIVRIIDDYEALLQEDPGNLDIRILLSRFLGVMQRHDRILAIYGEALERDPYNAQLLYELGNALLQAGQYRQARNNIRRSLEFEPAQPNAYVKLSQIDYETGDAVGHVRELLNAMQYDPRDHELPARVAKFLYELDLVEAGDDFRDRVLAIAPTSPAAYQIALVREIATGDEAAAIAAAKRAIEDDIDERNFSYGGAVQYLMRTAAKNGNVDETEAWIEQQAPGIFDVYGESVPPKYRVAQGASFDTWYQHLPLDEVKRRGEFLLELNRDIGIDPLDDPTTRMAVHSMRGETELAIGTALDEFFSRPVTADLQWRRTFAQPLYAPLLDDPRIQAGLEAWQQEHAAMREAVRDYLESLTAVEG